MDIALDINNLDIVGDLTAGRPTLGINMSVSTFRLVFYSLRAVLKAKYGHEKSNEIIYQAGKLAGKTLFNSLLHDSSSLEVFINRIQEIFLKSKMARISLKEYNLDNKIFSFYFTEDIECSGVPADAETKCDFDAGMISGMLGGFFKTEFTTKEIGCWGTGEKFCLFKSTPVS